MNKFLSQIAVFSFSLFALIAGNQTYAAEFSIQEESNGDIAIQIDGKLFTRYVTSDKNTNKCYFWPVIGPGEAKMTRSYPMEDVEGEKQDHPHHRGIFFGLQEAGGFNTWHERMTFTKKGVVNEEKAKNLAQQKQSKIIKAEAKGNSAILIVECLNIDPDGKPYLLETRHVKFHVADNGSRIIDFDITLKGVKESITVVGKKDSGLSIRVPHNMTVDAKKGGRIVNSLGNTDKEAWGNRADWVDFNGPVDGKIMGIAILNHPTSFRYPTPWHVRTYGLFTANPFALKEVGGEDESGDFELKKGETVLLKHQLIFHNGDEKAASIDKAWKAYSAAQKKRSH